MNARGTTLPTARSHCRRRLSYAWFDVCLWSNERMANPRRGTHPLVTAAASCPKRCGCLLFCAGVASAGAFSLLTRAHGASASNQTAARIGCANGLATQLTLTGRAICSASKAPSSYLLMFVVGRHQSDPGSSLVVRGHLFGLELAYWLYGFRGLY